MKLEDISYFIFRCMLICGVLSLCLFAVVNHNAHWKCYNESSTNWNKCYDDAFRGGSWLFIIPLLITGACLLITIVLESCFKCGKEKKDKENYDPRPPFQSGL